MILFGNSTARNATRYYNVGDMKTVLNLATHLYFGLQGDVLLLKRYLETHPSPSFVEIVATPSLFTEPPQIEKIRYYLWRVFSRPEEHDYLRELFPGIDGWSKYFAIFNIQQEILEPFMSLARHGQGHYYALGRDPDPNAPLEPASTDIASATALKERINAPLTMLPVHARMLHDLCLLSANYGFKIDIAWAPAPKAVAARWRETQAIDNLQTQMLQAMRGGCAKPSFTDFNESVDYLAFDRLARHLRGNGWEQLFAHKMQAHIKEVIDKVGGPFRRSKQHEPTM